MDTNYENTSDFEHEDAKQYDYIPSEEEMMPFEVEEDQLEENQTDSMDAEVEATNWSIGIFPPVCGPYGCPALGWGPYRCSPFGCGGYGWYGRGWYRPGWFGRPW